MAFEGGIEEDPLGRSVCFAVVTWQGGDSKELGDTGSPRKCVCVCDDHVLMLDDFLMIRIPGSICSFILMVLQVFWALAVKIFGSKLLEPRLTDHLQTQTPRLMTCFDPSLVSIQSTKTESRPQVSSYTRASLCQLRFACSLGLTTTSVRPGRPILSFVRTGLLRRLELNVMICL